MKPLRRSISSANALLVYEAAARHLSFTKAAGEFNVTQAAVSRMIRRLETHLGVELFDRRTNAIQLTPTGARLYAAVSRGFSTIAEALDEIERDAVDENTVSLSVTSAFATHWFLPRMQRLHEAYPEIDLRFHVLSQEAVGPVEEFDLAIRFKPDPDDDLVCWRLMKEHVVAVCSHAYLQEWGGLSTITPMAGHTLIRMTGNSRIPWERFLDHFDLPSPDQSRWLEFSDYSLVLQAAANGQGIALGWRHVITNLLLTGILTPAWPCGFATGDEYCLVASSKRPLRRATERVKNWLLTEMSTMDNQLTSLPEIESS
ncbi:MAG: LysR substrate-binding domain-containing protein [Pseudomonadota bacterium]